MEYNEEQISLAFDELPRSTQDVLFTPEIKEQVQFIGAPISALDGGIDELNALANMAILKLADEKDFAEKLKTKLKINNDVAQKITSSIFLQIVNPIRSKEKEEAAQKVFEEEIEASEESLATPEETPRAKKSNEWRSGAAPDNLPIADVPEYLIPPIQSKTTGESSGPIHPFEEKMKRVFTAGQQSMGELTLEPIPQPPVSSATHHDPYREAIE